jgi:hypothetical protein
LHYNGGLYQKVVLTVGATSTYSVPQAGYGYRPTSLAWRASDQTVWAAHQAGSLDSIASATGNVSNVADTDVKSSVLTTGNDGNIYGLSDFGFGIIQLDSITQGGTIDHMSFYGSSPALKAVPNSFVAGPPGTNTFWFIDSQTGKVGRISLGAQAL